MPQYLYINIAGVSIAQMRTENRGGTHYDIFWNSNQGYQEDFKNRDTGVECQPSDSGEKIEDFKNDFTHARRSIAAASSTAKQFLDNFLNNVNYNENNIEEVQVILKTNKRDRGKITIFPNDDQKAKLTMEIGTGPNRPQDAIPAQAESFIKDGIDLLGINSSITMISHVFDSECEWMLNIL